MSIKYLYSRAGSSGILNCQIASTPFLAMADLSLCRWIEFNRLRMILCLTGTARESRERGAGRPNSTSIRSAASLRSPRCRIR